MKKIEEATDGTMNRRQIMKLSGALAVTSTAGCTGGDGGSGEEAYGGQVTGPFRSRMWLERYANWRIPDFAEEWGIEATNQGYSAASIPYSQLQAGQHTGDCIDAFHPQAQRIWENGYAQSIDESLLTNFENIEEEYRNIGVDDDGERWGIPIYIGLQALVYNTDVFSSPPESLDVLWNDEYEGRITLWNNARTMCEIAALKTGQDPADPSDYDAIEEALLEQKPLVQNYWSNFEEGMRMFINEDVDVGMLTLGRTIQAALDNDAPVDYTVPEEGTLGQNDTFVIPENSNHVPTAYAWIDDYLENGYEMMDIARYRVPLKNRGEHVSDELAEWYQFDEDWDITFQELLDEDILNEYSNIWTSVQS